MNEMTFQIRTEGDICLYEQIYQHIRGEIRRGKLLAGERLPSTRALAEYLQVARSTVDYAYGQLLGEGYIESRPCRGYFVCPVEDLLLLDGDMELPGDSGEGVRAGEQGGRPGQGDGAAGEGRAARRQDSTVPGGNRQGGTRAWVPGRPWTSRPISSI